ncbi:hypothetical protein JL475_26475 [Streptomyces sp. M2CJ-2]|uniref:hypothetical protein n=1 Tax=Streptomyces sp. M2CJ-2 TaxID=2803948 RepID=UPI0019297C36|nr:hypothetical protein [Streptomyces sp. M2CJ-2]MBL3669466.1 hypothetical protein [Streptomyces sp. M2CJ-2]
MNEEEKSAATRLDHYMPVWHFREVHSVPVKASREEVLRVTKEATWKEAPAARFLLLFTKNQISSDSRIVDDFAKDGKNTLEIGESELVYGGIGTDAGPIESDRPLSEIFREFDEPGHTKIVFNFRYLDGRLFTETRVFLTDEERKRQFGRYWRIIRIPSGMTRLSLLHAVQRRVRAAA